VIRVMTGTGAGWGDPLDRPLELIKEDLKNGYITQEQAVKYYHLDQR
jgi:N-methylhydantoinase B